MSAEETVAGADLRVANDNDRPNDARWAPVATEALQRFGLARFRTGQRALIEAVLAGRDALGVLPTGGGKSLCYQLPALLLFKPTVVVCPLIALMEDQHHHLARVDVDAAAMNSTHTAREERQACSEIRRGAHPIIYVTPERLQTDACQTLLASRGVGLLAVDEAHCVSQWGHDFRPAYLGIAAAAERLGRPPIIALTATATPAAMVDIVHQLGLRAPCVVRPGVARTNLAFSVRRTVSDAAKERALRSIVAEEREGGIVYCATTKQVDAIAASLTSSGVRAAAYHGKLPMRARHAAQAAFMAGEVEWIVATKAFGLGIDKPDVRCVVHHTFPDSIDSYFQEAGRAGRDGAPAKAILLYRLEDKRIQTYFLGSKYPSEHEAQRLCEVVGAIRGEITVDELAEACGAGRKKTEVLVAKLQELGLAARHGGDVRRLQPFDVAAMIASLARTYQARDRADHARLDDMMRYAQSTRCRMQTLLAYFGETDAAACGRCDNCEAIDGALAAAA